IELRLGDRRVRVVAQQIGFHRDADGSAAERTRLGQGSRGGRSRMQHYGAQTQSQEEKCQGNDEKPFSSKTTKHLCCPFCSSIDGNNPCYMETIIIDRFYASRSLISLLKGFD